MPICEIAFLDWTNKRYQTQAACCVRYVGKTGGRGPRRHERAWRCRVANGRWALTVCEWGKVAPTRRTARPTFLHLPVRQLRGLRSRVPAGGVAGGTIDCLVRVHFTPALRDHRVRRCAVGSRVLASRLADAMRSSNDGSSLQKEARELCEPANKIKRDQAAPAQDNLSPLAAGRAWKVQARDYDWRPRVVAHAAMHGTAET